MKGPSSKYTEEEIARGLTAVVLMAGNARRACDYLQEEHDLQVPEGTLSSWKNHLYADRYMEMRDQYRGQIEAQLANELTDGASLGARVTIKALEKAEDRLDRNKDRDPARTAANIASAVDKLTRDSLVLQNRPSAIQETRGIEESLRALIAMGVLLPPQLPAPSVDAELVDEE